MFKYRELDLTSSLMEQNEIIENYIKKMVSPEGGLQILEAGCGQYWALDLGDVNYVLTGVDLDKHALNIRKNVRNDLHETIEADLRSVRLQDSYYDVIYNSFVLEHIKGAEQVLNNFKKWIKPEGILVLLIPDRSSVQGFITRFTPHWFHVFYYRLLGLRNAGKPGYAPYPVQYDSVVSREGIRDFCIRNKLILLKEYGEGFNEPGKGIVKLLIKIFKRVVSALSFGMLSYKHTNLLYIIQKPRRSTGSEAAA